MSVASSLLKTFLCSLSSLRTPCSMEIPACCTTQLGKVPRQGGKSSIELTLQVSLVLGIKHLNTFPCRFCPVLHRFTTWVLFLDKVYVTSWSRISLGGRKLEKWCVKYHRLLFLKTVHFYFWKVMLNNWKYIILFFHNAFLLYKRYFISGIVLFLVCWFTWVSKEVCVGYHGSISRPYLTSDICLQIVIGIWEILLKSLTLDCHLR